MEETLKRCATSTPSLRPAGPLGSSLSSWKQPGSETVIFLKSPQPLSLEEGTTMKLSTATIVAVAAVVTSAVVPAASALQMKVDDGICTFTLTADEEKTIRLATANAVEQDLLAQAPSSAGEIRRYFSSLRDAIANPTNTNLAGTHLHFLALLGSGMTQEQKAMAGFVGADYEGSYGITHTFNKNEAAQILDHGLAAYWALGVDAELYPDTARVITDINGTITTAVQACIDGTDVNIMLPVQVDLGAYGGGSFGSSGFSPGSS